jgi:hypothetical protein
MIKKDITYGASGLWASVELGKGDVLISPAVGQNKDYVCIMFSNQEKAHPIGEETTDTVGKTSDDIKPQVVIFFDNIQSIDVLMWACREAKRAIEDKSILI